MPKRSVCLGWVEKKGDAREGREGMRKGEKEEREERSLF